MLTVNLFLRISGLERKIITDMPGAGRKDLQGILVIAQPDGSGNFDPGDILTISGFALLMQYLSRNH